MERLAAEPKKARRMKLLLDKGEAGIDFSG